MSSLEDRLKPFPSAFVHTMGHGHYVSHGVVAQRLLDLYGSFDTTVVREVYDDGTLTGVLLRLTVTDDDGTVTVEEWGDSDRPLEGQTNGQRAKLATSDALKRCAMRLGVGLHLWAGDESYLHDKLSTETA